MRKGLVATVIQLALLSGAVSAAERSVAGTVYYKGGEPATDAAIELEDKSTLQVVSHRSDKEGHYKFFGLSSDKDYEIRATKKGYWSKAHSLSRFSSAATENVDLYLAPSKKD